jgi:thiamine transport system permease protein
LLALSHLSPRAWRGLPGPRALLALPLLFLAVMVAAPVLRLVWEGMALSSGAVPGTEGDGALSAWGVWADAHLRFRLLWSLAQAGISTALTLLLGLPVAWVLARYQFAGRSWALRLLMLPFVVPTLVAALGVLALWGPQGHWSVLLGLDAEESPWLLVVGNLFFNLCLVVRAGVDALGQVSASRLAAARTLGATPWRAFWRVEWPAIRLPVASALCLVFLYCFAGMGLALVLGGQRWATAEVEIYTLVAHELRLADASALALWTLVIGGLLTAVYAVLAGRLAQPRRADGVPPRRLTRGYQRVAVALALTVLGAVSVAPLVATVAWALADVPALWQVWTAPDTLDALWNTVRFSGMALAAATLLGLCQGLAVFHWNTSADLQIQAKHVDSKLINKIKRCVAFFMIKDAPLPTQGLVQVAVRRSASPHRKWGVLVRASTLVPFVVSPVAVAFGLLLLYPGLTASLALLVAAYTLLAYPFVGQHVANALDALPPHWHQAARTLGASPWRVFVRITLPLVAPALRRGMAFAAATALGEFAVSLFLSRPEWTTLTTLIYQHLGRPGADNLHAAHALSLLLMLLALGVFVLLDVGSTSPQARPRSARHMPQNLPQKDSHA